jgi:hypothetical protein
MAWYLAQRRDKFKNTGSHDDLHEQYPSTDVQALSARTLNKRIAPLWLQQCYVEQDPIALEDLPPEAPSIPGLLVYHLPDPNRRYVIGIDPAEGHTTSNDSALTVGDADTLEEVASLSGKIEPSVLADYANQIGIYFNYAGVMVERNNHGHAVLLWLTDHGELAILDGFDGHPGWLSNSRGKTLLYNTAADTFREPGTILHSFKTFTQLASIERATLSAPEGEADDCADSYALMIVGAGSTEIWTETW